EWEKLSKDRSELRKDNREIRGERRDVNDDVNAGRPGMAAADEREKGRDKGERREDVRDLERERIQRVRTRAIALELQGLQGRFDGPSLNQKQALIGELMQIARNEIH